MNKFTDQEIAETAYYIWKNNGCPANTQAQDWEAAIRQLSARSCNSNRTANDISKTNMLKRYATAKAKKITPVSESSKLKALKLAYATNVALQDTGTVPLKTIATIYRQTKI